jgi:hypothetical protein
MVVQEDERVGLDGLRVVFDDERLVSGAGIALVATLVGRLGIEALVGRFVALRRDLPSAANPGRKVIALVFAMPLGADSIHPLPLLVHRVNASVYHPRHPLEQRLPPARTGSQTRADRVLGHGMAEQPLDSLMDLDNAHRPPGSNQNPDDSPLYHAVTQTPRHRLRRDQLARFSPSQLSDRRCLEHRL